MEARTYLPCQYTDDKICNLLYNSWQVVKEDDITIADRNIICKRSPLRFRAFHSIRRSQKFSKLPGKKLKILGVGIEQNYIILLSLLKFIVNKCLLILEAQKCRYHS